MIKTADEIYDIIEKIKNQKPLIHCITNIVTVNDCANALLALGASPTMAHHIEEVEEVVDGCNSLVINLGATECYDAMKTAAKRAKEKNKPMVLDPVGVAGTTFRRELAKDVLSVSNVTCIRGNYSEIRALCYDRRLGTGVDVLLEDVVENAAMQDSINGYAHTEIIEAVKELAARYNTIVCASGAIDYISDGTLVYQIHNGSDMMPRITGAGCMSSCAFGAFFAIEQSVGAAVAACVTMGVIGEIAEMLTKKENGKIGTFHTKFFDAMDLITKEDLQKRIAVTKMEV